MWTVIGDRKNPIITVLADHLRSHGLDLQIVSERQFGKMCATWNPIQVAALLKMRNEHNNVTPTVIPPSRDMVICYDHHDFPQGYIQFLEKVLWTMNSMRAVA